LTLIACALVAVNAASMASAASTARVRSFI
jgi:hypothetical protein